MQFSRDKLANFYDTHQKAMNIALGFLIILYIVFLGSLVINHDVIAFQGDPIEYIEGAKDLFNYESAFHPPLYSVAIAFLELATSDYFFAGKLVSMISFFIVLLMTWQLGRMCFNSISTAIVGVVTVSLSPTLIKYSYVVGSDMLGVALFLSCIYGLLISDKKIRKAAIVCGILAGLAYLTRYVYVGVVPAALFYLIFIHPGQKKEKLVRVILFSVAFLVIISPWSLICISRHGNLHNLNHVNIAFAIFDTTNSWLMFDTYAEKYPTLSSLILSHPAQIAKHFAKNLLHFPLEIIVRHGLLSGVFLLMGIYVVLRKPTREQMLLQLSTGALLILTLLAWLSPRFFIPLIPPFFLLSSEFITNRLDSSFSDYWPENGFVTKTLTKINLRTLAVSLTILVALAYTIVKVPSDFRQSNIDDEKKAGVFIRSQTPDNTPVLTSSRNLAWYSKRPFVPMNRLIDVSADNLEEAAKNSGAKVIVYTKRHSTWTHPQLEFLLNPDDYRVPESFRLLYHDEGEWPVTVYSVDN